MDDVNDVERTINCIIAPMIAAKTKCFRNALYYSYMNHDNDAPFHIVTRDVYHKIHYMMMHHVGQMISRVRDIMPMTFASIDYDDSPVITLRTVIADNAVIADIIYKIMCAITENAEHNCHFKLKFSYDDITGDVKCNEKCIINVCRNNYYDFMLFLNDIANCKLFSFVTKEETRITSRFNCNDGAFLIIIGSDRHMRAVSLKTAACNVI